MSLNPRPRSLQIIPFLSLLIILISPSCWGIDFYDKGSPEEIARKIVDDMSDEDLLGQALMFGYPSAFADARTLEWIEKRGLGGVKVFGWNGNDPKTIAFTVTEFQKGAAKTKYSIPLLIATDQEGGHVRHVRGNTTVTPGTMSLGASSRPYYDAYQTGVYIGIELRSMGINMNFAPVVDLYNNPTGSIMGTRCFGADPLQTAFQAMAYYKGHKSKGIISTAKHFPGHGNTSIDSHGRLPVVKTNREDFVANELLPYRFLAKEDIPAIMVGHINYPNITGDNKPASLSSVLLTDILKNELQYKGFVITDDMIMHGVRSMGGSIAQLSLQAFRAGVDMILISETDRVFVEIWNLCLAEMKRDSKFRERIKDAAYRIIRVKCLYLRGENAVSLDPSSKLIDQSVPAPGGEEFFLSQACRSVSVIRKGFLPVLPGKKRILLAGSYRNFIDAGKARYPNARVYLYPEYPSTLPVSGTILRLAQNADVVILCVADRADLAVLRQLRSLNKKVVAFSIFSPIGLAEIDWLESAIAAYGFTPASFVAGFGVVTGDYEATGKVPF